MKKITLNNEELFDRYEEELADCDELIPINNFGIRIIICIDKGLIKGIYLEDENKKEAIFSGALYKVCKPRNLDEIQ